MADIVTESDLYNFNQGTDDPPPPPGFVADDLSTTNKALLSIPKGGSRLAGILVGSLNAPLSFIQGMQNAPIYNPEEWDKMEWYKKPLIMLGGGLESAGRSALKQGDFGEQYSAYYQSKTGSTLEKDFGAAAPIIQIGLDLIRDPLVGPAMAVDLAKLNIRTAGQFLKYIKSGATPFEGKAVSVVKGTTDDLAKLQADESAIRAEELVTENIDTAKLRQQIIDTLSNRKDKLTKDQFKLYDEKRAAASRDDASIWAYAHEAQGGEFPDLPVYGKEFETTDAAIRGFDDAIKIETEAAQANDYLQWAVKHIEGNIAPSAGVFVADVKSVLPEVTTESMWKQALEDIKNNPQKVEEIRAALIEKNPDYKGKIEPTTPTPEIVQPGEYSITAEDFELRPDKMKDLQKGIVSFKVGDKVISAKVGSKVNGQEVYNHSDLGVAKNLDFDTAIPGFLDKKGNFVEQYPKQPGATSAGKQPWEMTRDEFRKTWDTPEFRKEFPNYKGDQDHGAIIGEAIDKGKPVPPEVLKDYPELKGTGVDIPTRIVNLEKKKGKTKGPESILGRVMQDGGIKDDASYNSKLLRESPDGKRVMRKNGKYTADDWAAMLTDEGYVGIETGDKLIQSIESGEARNIFTPEKRDVMINRQIRSLEDEYLQTIDFDELARNERASQKDIKTEIIGELREEAKLSPSEEAAALKDAEDFFAEVSKKPVKEETANLPRLSYEETFELQPPETEWGATKGKSNLSPNEKLFGKPTEMQAFVGAGYGVEQDENGNVTVDPVKAALGMLGGFAATQIKFKPQSFNELAKNMSPDAQKVASMYADTMQARIDREATTFSKVRNSFVRMVTDVGGNLKREVKNIDPVFGKEVEIRKSLAAGASSKASNINQTYHDLIFKDLSVQDYEVMGSIINSKRTAHIDDYKGIGTVEHSRGLTGVEHLSYMDELEKADPVKFADLNARVDLYNDAMHEQLKAGFDEGLYSKEAYDDLVTHFYSPRKYLQHLDDVDFQTGSKLSVPEGSVIKSLDEGSVELMETRPDLLLAEVVNRRQSQIFNNKAARALYDFADVNPGNGIAEVAKIVKYTDDGKPVYETTPGGFQKVKMMENGEQKEILMPNEFAQEWVKNDPLINQSLATILRWGSGSTVLKAGATGYNPVFALANMARDLAQVWGVTTEYSAHAPVALMQLARDLNAVKGDVFKRSGRVMDYINEGGGMELLTYYGRFKGQGEIGEKLDNVGKLLGWIGETSEIWTRVALRERALRNGKSAEEATFIARNYMDFNQGGNVAKALDVGLPYLNAGIVGTRSVLRAAKESPATFAYKMAQLGVLASGLYFANMSVNPEVYKNVLDRDKEGNFIITTPLSYTDSDGIPRDAFIKIPKSQGQRVITTFFEAALAKIYEGKYPTQQMVQAIADFANSSFIPPSVAATLAYFGNYDAWTMDQVWKGSKVPASSEYNTDTNPLSVGLGQATGTSPMRIEAAFNKLVPSNNFFVGLVGGGIRAITNAFDPITEKKTLTEMALSNQAIKRFVSQTSPMNQYRLEHEEIKTKEVGRRFEQARELDKISDSYFKTRDPKTYQMIEQYIDAQPEEDQDRLIDRTNRHAQVAQLPDKFWWLSAGSMPPKARAEAFVKRWDEETINGRSRMIDLSGKINGFGGEDFVSEVDRIKGRK